MASKEEEEEEERVRGGKRGREGGVGDTDEDDDENDHVFDIVSGIMLMYFDVICPVAVGTGLFDISFQASVLFICISICAFIIFIISVFVVVDFDVVELQKSLITGIMYTYR